MTAAKELAHATLEGLYEIRLESIGGLGANLAGKMLAEAGVLHLGLNGSNSSSYGSEKKGSPVSTHIRFAHPDTQIRVVSPVERPMTLAVFHEALLKSPSATRGLHAEGVLIVNTTKTPSEIREETSFFTGTVVCVDALGIAVEEKTRINTAMLGVIARVVDFLDAAAVKAVIRETFGKKYPALVEANLRTFDRGFSEVVIDVSEAVPDASVASFQHVVSELGFDTQAMGGVIMNPGNSIAKDLSASRQGFLPGLDLDKCIHCANCDQVCPDFCFVWEAREDAKGRVYQFLKGIDYQYCKGCLKCVTACPTDALSGVRELDGYAQENRVAHSFEFIG